MRLGRLLVALIAAALAAVAGWRLLVSYEGPWESFTQPTRAFLSAAVGRDSLQLARLGMSAAVIQRARALGAAHPDRFAIAGRPRVAAAQQLGDTTRLTYPTQPCPLVLTFVGRRDKARLTDFGFPCPPE
jgi:hypothetical protein